MRSTTDAHRSSASTPVQGVARALRVALMIGLVLVAEGFHQHIEKGYVYGAMAFSVFVELLNLGAKRKKQAAAEKAAG